MRSPFDVFPEPVVTCLTLRFKKKNESGAVLTCVRTDGSVTSTDIGRHGSFGPMHDLSHYAVESRLGLSQGFLGLVAAGWDVEDFEQPGATARLPDEAAWTEAIAGQLSIELGTGHHFALEDFNAGIRAGVGTRARGMTRVDVTADELAGCRRAVAELAGQWFALTPGETLILEFRPEPPEGP